MLTVLFSIVTAAMLNVSEPMQNNYVAEESAIAAESSNQDKPLGSVNMCDSNGTKCYVWYAFQDAENGRIYIKTTPDQVVKYYAQKSNDSRWQYMIWYNNSWLYFSF